MVDEDIIYKFMEFIIFSSYLIFIFLSVQIWYLWKDIDKKELKLHTFINEDFYIKNCVYVFFFTLLFMIHEFYDEITMHNLILYFKFFDMLAFVSVSLFAYHWYNALKTCPNRKSLPRELINSR